MPDYVSIIDPLSLSLIRFCTAGYSVYSVYTDNEGQYNPVFIFNPMILLFNIYRC